MENNDLIAWVKSIDSGLYQEEKNIITESFVNNGIDTNRARYLTDEEWKELIPNIGARGTVRKYISTLQLTPTDTQGQQVEQDLGSHKRKLDEYIYIHRDILLKLEKDILELQEVQLTNDIKNMNIIN
ncbi:hypothetical protein DLAC_08041 [Tieghemostelium lacteum]|uniref:Uncharacterized protein n=1 Tax=Tieghemostelium lacteum TaxID=361077 RepID=A0A151ZB75_TIELA|nr:hypothetical protein DLAC_08041 [Tieghemostelium lacteum]|eukprot:KYQ91134.1 hypothetical protein DLAC_08041 [Tieghemostelium lacteum]